MTQRLLGVAATLVVGLVLVPLVALVWAALNPAPDPFGGEAPTLAAIWTASRTPALILRSLGLSIGVAVTALAVGGGLAWADARLEYPGRRLGSTGVLLILAMPSYVLAATMARTLGPGGFIGGPLSMGPFGGMAAALLVLSVVTIPYVFLIVGAALARQSASEHEAARLLGAQGWRLFRTVSLPHLRPALGFSGLVVLLYAISDFGAVAVLDTPVLTWRLYQAVAGQDLARAAILGLGLLGTTLPLFAVARLVHGRGPEPGVANPRVLERSRASGTQAALVWTALVGVLGLGLVIPLASLALWVADGLQRGLPFAPLGASLMDTLKAGLLGASATFAFAALPAWVVGRSQSRSTAALEQGLWLTSALPGVLLAFGLLLGALGISRALGGGELYATLLSTGVLLYSGYAMRFAAEAYAPLKTSVLQLDDRQLESARVLGAGPWRQLRYVIAPALAPGAGAALLIGFLAVLKELPVTLLLGSATGLRTLAFRVWDRYSEALWHDAGASGLALVALALVGVIATLPWRRHV